jgi:hypothetical protein
MRRVAADSLQLSAVSDPFLAESWRLRADGLDREPKQFTPPTFRSLEGTRREPDSAFFA